MLATRLERYMPYLVHNDQTGFIKSRLASDNVRCLLHVIDTASGSADQSAILSLDAEKAFGMVLLMVCSTVYGFQ